MPGERLTGARHRGSFLEHERERSQTKMATTVLMAHQGNLGYGAEQVQTGVTLADLLEQVQDAITEWGDDALVVMRARP